MKITRSLLAAGAALAVLGGTAVTAGATINSPLLNRVARGDLSQPGGAARLNGDETGTIRSAIQDAGAKNVILIIGDGMGDSEITSGRNYLEGAGGAFSGLDALPMTGQMTHYSLYKDGKPDYTPDSAATGSAWATGTKTYDNAISVDIHGKPQQTLLQLAKAGGRATGNVSTAEIQDATPAVQVANINLRKCYGPKVTSAECPDFAKENGGPGSITEQLLDTRPDVTLGGGAKTFSETATAGVFKGKTLEQQAKERGFQYLTDPNALAGVRRVDQKSPLLGLFNDSNLPVKFAPLVATPDGATKAPQRCTDNPDYTSAPSLKLMTSKATELLSQTKDGHRNGFFLQVESASIDKKDHAADACGQIGEMSQLNDAVDEALKFARRDGNTLVLVTADHAHTSQIVDAGTPGLNANLLTADGSPMLLSYNTAAAAGSQQHTGTQVRVAGFGPGAANVVGLVDQTDLFGIINNGMAAYGRKPR